MPRHREEKPRDDSQRRAHACSGAQDRQHGVPVREGGPVRAQHETAGHQQECHHRQADDGARLNGADHEALQLGSPPTSVQVGDERQHDEDERLSAQHRQPRELTRGTVQTGVAGTEHRPDDQDVRLLRQNELRPRNHDEAANGPHPLVALELGRGGHGRGRGSAAEQEEAHTQGDRRRRGVEGHRLARRKLCAEPHGDEPDADAEQDRAEDLLRELRLRHSSEPLERAAAVRQERGYRHENAGRPNSAFDPRVEASPEQPSRDAR